MQQLMSTLQQVQQRNAAQQIPKHLACQHIDAPTTTSMAPATGT
jgi:hypothetical protein